MKSTLEVREVKDVMPIEEKSLESIEYLLAQSAQGVHLLFDNPSIAKVLSQPTEQIDFFNFDNITKIQDLFSKLIDKKSLVEKQIFLEKLDRESFEILLRTYFHIVENTILASSDFKH